MTGPSDAIKLLLGGGLLPLCNGRQDETQHGQHHGGDDVQRKGEGVLIVHTQHAADRSDGKAPAAKELGDLLALDEAVICRDLIVGIAQGDVGSEHPQVTHGHAHGVQLGELTQHGGSTGHEGLCQNDGAGQHRHHLDTVAVDAVGVDLVEPLRDELLGVLVVQQHTQGSVDAEDQHGKLADDVAQSVDDHEQVAHVVILTQLLECPVGAVCRIGVEAFGAGVDDGGVKHPAHGKSAQDRTGDHHACQSDHAPGEALAGVFHLVDVGGDLFTAAHGKHQDGQRSKVGNVEGGDQAAEAQVGVDILCGGVDRRCGEHHDDVQQRHDKGAGAGGSQQLLQGVQTQAGNVAAQQQDAEGGKLDITGGNGVVGLRIPEDRPAQCLQEAAALAGNVGDVACPVGPACVVGKLGVGGLVQPGADAAALVFKGGTQLAHHEGVGDEIKGKHQDPAEDDLGTIEVHKAVGDVAEAPDRGERHKGEGLPRDLCGLFFF